MAFTIVQGTILQHLIAFEYELSRLAKEHKYSSKNGVVVSTIEANNRLVYHKAEPGKPGETAPISRSVVVVFSEEGWIDVFYRVTDKEIFIGAKMKYPFITESNDAILNFLIHGTIPHQGQ